MSFEELRTYFAIVRQRFDAARDLEEKLRLVAISKEIVREAESQIEESILVLRSRY
jgi:hypothetical protein